jgi:hypothetical protein
MKKDSLIARIHQLKLLKNELAELKKMEMDLRLEVAEEISNNQSGVHKWEAETVKVKVTNGLNYRLDKEILERNWDMMSQDERDCVRFKPELNLRDYKQMSDDVELLEEAITITPAAPVVDIKFTEED